jgi:hypothetical protein
MTSPRTGIRFVWDPEDHVRYLEIAATPEAPCIPVSQYFKGNEGKKPVLKTNFVAKPNQTYVGPAAKYVQVKKFDTTKIPLIQAVLGIRDILVRNPPGSAPLTNGSGSNFGSDSFLQ